MKNNNDPQHELARAVALTLTSRAWKIALAESCTGGLVCATLTGLAGSSDWFERGYVTYSNAAKSECLNVPAETIESFGAVSEQVAKAMAEGALRNANVNAAISITGVCFGWAVKESIGDALVNTVTLTKHFNGDRQIVREQARDFALSQFLELLKPKNT